jgi:hypothetical protein
MTSMRRNRSGASSLVSKRPSGAATCTRNARIVGINAAAPARMPIEARMEGVPPVTSAYRIEKQHARIPSAISPGIR